MKTQATVRSEKVKATIRAKAIQMAESSLCGHCGVPYVKVNQHIPVCIMNPERKPRGGMIACSKCNFLIPGKNVNRHADSCNGNMPSTIDSVLQSFRSEYLNIMRGGKSFNGNLDRSLGYGNRAVPEVVRVNVENDLRQRGMPSDWSIAPNLSLLFPTDTEINAGEVEIPAVEQTVAASDPITSVVDLITDERSLAEVLNQIINLATYKLATR